MRKEIWLIVFLCAIGAFTGALVSLELAARFSYGEYLRFVGALVGGGIGYFAYDFHTVLRGIAWVRNAVCGRRPNPIRQRTEIRLVGLWCIFNMCWGTIVWTGIFPFFVIATMLSINGRPVPNAGEHLIFAVVSCGVSALLFALGAAATQFLRESKNFARDFRSARRNALRMNILVAPFFILVGCPTLGLARIAKFMRQVFISVRILRVAPQRS